MALPLALPPPLAPLFTHNSGWDSDA